MPFRVRSDKGASINARQSDSTETSVGNTRAAPPALSDFGGQLLQLLARSRRQADAPSTLGNLDGQSPADPVRSARDHRMFCVQGMTPHSVVASCSHGIRDKSITVEVMEQVYNPEKTSPTPLACALLPTNVKVTWEIPLS